MKILTVVGTRPQFLKLAPLSKKFEEEKINHIVETYIDTHDFNELYQMVIKAEDDSLITVACRKCNKDLEDK